MARCCGVITGVLLLTCGWLVPAHADPSDDCNSSDATKMLSGCTAVLATASAAEELVAALARRGFAEKQLGRCDAAIADFSNVLHFAPPTAAVLVLRGECYAALNQPKPALADFEAALQLDPQNAEAAAGRNRLVTTGQGPPIGAPVTNPAPGLAAAPKSAGQNPQSPASYGAVAADSRSTAYGMASRRGSVEQADEAALCFCRSGGAQDCRIVLRYGPGMCAAAAHDGLPGKSRAANGWSTDSNLETARANALTNCQSRGGSACTVRLSNCNTGRIFVAPPGSACP